MKEEDKSNYEIYEIEVNGVEINVKSEKLVALDILKLAAENGAIGTKPEQNVLESEEPPRTFKDDEWVDFLEYKKFIAEVSAPTPVAFEVWQL